MICCNCGDPTYDMKKLILFIPLIFACSGGDGGSDDSNNPCPVHKGIKK